MVRWMGLGLARRLGRLVRMARRLGWLGRLARRLVRLA